MIRHKRRIAKTTFAIILASGILLSACQSKPPLLTPILPSPSAVVVLPSQVATRIAEHATPTPKPSSTPWPVASYTPSPTPTEAVLGDINPLTGLRVNQPELLQQRPVLVKIANWPEGLRPADGLNHADMVFEYYIGGQSNHLLALYYGDDYAHVGPLGSGRVIDARLTEHQQGNLIIASSDQTLETILEEYLPKRYTMRGYAPCPGICTDTVAQGGNTFVDTAAVRTILAERNTESFTPELFGLAFSETAPDSAHGATRFSYLYADFSVMDWRFNTETEAYELWQDKKVSARKYTLEKSQDRSSGEPIAFENIVFLFNRYLSFPDDFYDINFLEGEIQHGILLRDGKMYHIKWSSAGFFDPFLFYDLEGNPFPLKPGKTWVTLTSLNSKIEQVDEEEWDLTFILK